MKQKFLKLNKPCTEQWENMTANEKGHFCDICAKNVIDFTQLSQEEILAKLKAANGSLCARVTKKQLNTPLFELETQKNYQLPYSKIAASLMMATSLVAVQPPFAAQNLQAENPTVQTINMNKPSHKSNNNKKKSKQKSSNSDNFTEFKGKAVEVESEKTLANVKIEFVTIHKIFETRTLEDGTFSLKLPSEVIDDDNLVRISFDEVERTQEERYKGNLEGKDIVLTKAEITTEYIIEAQAEMMLMGGMHSGEYDFKPTVLQNGKEIPYTKFAEALQGKKSRLNLKTKEYHFFDAHVATALYDKVSKDGLYLLFDKKK